MDKKNSKFRLGDKMGYVSPFEESPFRKEWAERREREEEVREEMEKRKALSSVSLYEDKDRKKTQNYRTNLYVAINEEFNKATSQSAIIEGWTLFNVNSIDDEKFIQHIQHYKWDTLIISTHGTSGDMYVDNAYFVEHNINMVEERHGGWFYFGVNADNKHLTMFSAYFANYLKQTYKLNIEGGNAPKDPTSVGYASLTESDIKKMNETFATIFMCAKSDARFLFNACKTVTANEYLADVMAALAQRLGFNGALYFGKFAMTYRETEKPAPNIVTHSEVIKFSENLLKYDPSYLGSKKGLLKVIIPSRFVPTMYNTIPAPTKTYLTNICISPFNGVIEQ